MTRPDESTPPPARAVAEPGSAPSADAGEPPPGPLALEPLSPIAAPDHRWFRPAHGPR
jgi:hypothetical protein